MSTRASIIWWYVGRSSLHLYRECLDDTVRLNVQIFGVRVINKLWLGTLKTHWNPHGSWWLGDWAP